MLTDILKEKIRQSEEKMASTIEFLKKELDHISTGKAKSSMLENIKVEYYGTFTSLLHMASIHIPTSREFVIKPYEKSMIMAIEKAIIASPHELNPVADKEVIRINLPQLTEERRANLVKQAKEIAEKAKIAIRNTRREYNNIIRKDINDQSLPKDSRFEAEDKMNDLTHKFSNVVEDILEKKNKEIMTI